MDFYINTKSDIKKGEMIGTKVGFNIYSGKVIGTGYLSASDDHHFCIGECQMAEFLYDEYWYKTVSRPGWYERLCKVIIKKEIF